MVIDDLRFNRLILTTLLSRLGHTVYEAQNVQEALALLAARRFHVVFLDWILPDGRGGIVARQIRRSCPETVIIAISADTSEDMNAECLAAGVDGILAKNFRLESVRDMLQTAIGNRADAESANLTSHATPAAGQEEATSAACIREFLTTHRALFPDGIDSALQKFRLQLAEEWKRLALAIESGQPNQAALAAHNLASLAGIFGAAPLRRVALACEIALRNPSSASVEAAVTRLSAMLDAVNDELDNPNPASPGNPKPSENPKS